MAKDGNREDSVNNQTHYDPVEAGGFCHEACGLAEIRRLREELGEMKRVVERLEGIVCALYDDGLISGADCKWVEKIAKRRL